MRVALVTATALAGHLGGVAAAQTSAGRAAGSGVVEEVIVTARRREERLIDVPVAVTVIDQEDLARYATVDGQTLSTQLPGVELRPTFTGSGAVLSIRGLTTTNDAGAESTVSTVVDGVPSSRGRLMLAGMLDLQSVELMKGPQALYFGKNSPAGVLSLTSISPGSEFGGYGRVGYNFANEEKLFEGAVSIPINDLFGVRVAFRHRKQGDGWVKNPVPAAGVANPFDSLAHGRPLINRRGPGDLPGTDETVGRITVRFRPTEDFDLNYKYLQQRMSNSSMRWNITTYSCAPGRSHLTVSAGATGRLEDTVGSCDPKDRHNPIVILPTEVTEGWPLSNGGVPYAKLAQDVHSLNASYRVGDVDLASTTGFYTSLARYGGDNGFDGTSFAQLGGASRERYTAWTQELRVNTRFDGPLNIMAGAYFDDARRSFRQNSKVLPVAPDPITRRTDNYDFINFTHSTTLSGFVQASYQIVDNLELSAGARYTHERKRIKSGNIYVHPSVEALRVVTRSATLPPIQGSLSDDNISPEVTLTWHPKPQTTLYAAYKTGYLSPGFSSPTNLPANATFENQQFFAETVRGYELGAKAARRSFTAELVLFTYDFNDLQVNALDPTTIAFFIRNAGKARTRGAELSGTYRVDDNLSLRGQVAYYDSTYIRYDNAACRLGQTVAEGCINRSQDLSGRNLPGASDWTMGPGAEYTRGLGGDLTLGLTVDGLWRSPYVINRNYRPGWVQKSFWLWNSSLRLSNAAQGWEVSLIGRNLFDQFYAYTAEDKIGGLPGETTGAMGNPREVLLQLIKTF